MYQPSPRGSRSRLTIRWNGTPFSFKVVGRVERNPGFPQRCVVDSNRQVVIFREELHGIGYGKVDEVDGGRLLQRAEGPLLNSLNGWWQHPRLFRFVATQRAAERPEGGGEADQADEHPFSAGHNAEQGRHRTRLRDARSAAANHEDPSAGRVRLPLIGVNAKHRDKGLRITSVQLVGRDSGRGDRPDRYSTAAHRQSEFQYAQS